MRGRGRGWDGGGRVRHGQRGQGGPGRGDGGGLGHQREVHLDLPALVHLGRAAMTTRGPGAVRDPDQVGAAKWSHGESQSCWVMLSYKLSHPQMRKVFKATPDIKLASKHWDYKYGFALDSGTSGTFLLMLWGFLFEINEALWCCDKVRMPAEADCVVTGQRRQCPGDLLSYVCCVIWGIFLPVLSHTFVLCYCDPSSFPDHGCMRGLGGMMPTNIFKDLRIKDFHLRRKWNFFNWILFHIKWKNFWKLLYEWIFIMKSNFESLCFKQNSWSFF